MTTSRSILMLLCAALVAGACEENAVQDITAPDAGSARVKFFNFGVGAPAVNFFADNTKMTALLSTSCTVITDANMERCTTTGTESASGVAYGSVGSGGFYSAIAPGQYTLSGRIAATVDKDLPVSNLPATLAEGKHYSFYQSGIYNTATKTIDSFIVEDPFIAEFDYEVAYVRFVNAVSNAAGPMTLYLKDRNTGADVVVGGAVAYKAAGEFTAVPQGAYDLSTRYTGSSTNVMTRTNVSFIASRVYTIAARGNITVASTLLLDNTANR